MNTHFLNKRLAHLLGFAGLIPFIALSLACWIVHPGWYGAIIKAQMAYGIAILSFLGGIHWGATVICGELSVIQTKKALIWGIMPALVAWIATVIAVVGIGFALLIAGFIAAYQIDKRLYAWYRMPEWFLRLRFSLTCVVVAALLLTFLAANLRKW